MTQTTKEQTTYNELDQKIQAEAIKPLVTKEIIEEHKRKLPRQFVNVVLLYGSCSRCSRIVIE